MNVKLGFIPSHREPFGEQWGIDMRERCLKAMKRIPGLKVIAPDARLTQGGLVRNLADAQKTLKLFLDNDIQGVIVGGMTFGGEVYSVGGIISHLPKPLPVLHFATKGMVAEDGTRPSDSWCGQFMHTSALRRRHITFEHIPTCFPEEPVFGEWVSRFTRACAAQANFRGKRIGQLGARPTEFESVWWDEASLQRDFNQMVIPIDLAEVFMRLDNTRPDDPAVQQAVAEIHGYARVPKQAERSLVTLARLEVALKRLADEQQLDVMAVNCWPQVQERYNICVCSVLGRLTDAGYPCACEVDVYGAATMLAAIGAGLGKTDPHFIDWTELHPTEENVWLAWHCGNAPVSLCAADCASCLQQHSIIPTKSYGTLEFPLRPGPVTCCRLVEYDGAFTMFLGTGEVVEMAPKVRGSYGWVKVKDVLDWERKMVEHGIIHHGVLIHDPAVADALESFCKFNNIAVVRGA